MCPLRLLYRPPADGVSQRKEPFVAPAGGRVDEIIRAGAACPSGALSVGLAEQDPVGASDTARAPAVEVSLDGPYRVTGAIELLDGDASPEARNDGASLEHYSLCRCGQSQNKPFCSGMHWYADFHDPPAPEQATLFEWAGGFPALLRLTRRFYETHVPEDPLLSGLFSQMSPDHPQRVAAWLGQVFGGPPAYSDHYGEYDRMISQHLDKALTPDQRARWVQLLARSADDVGLPADAEFRAAFVAYLEWGSRIALENSQPGVHPPPHMPVPRWWWVCDAEPWSRAHASTDEVTEEPAAPLPGPDEPVSFAAHIKPLFRARDRDSMRFAFDLWAYDDVSTHAVAIADRLHRARCRVTARGHLSALRCLTAGSPRRPPPNAGLDRTELTQDQSSGECLTAPWDTASRLDCRHGAVSVHRGHCADPGRTGRVVLGGRRRHGRGGPRPRAAGPQSALTPRAPPTTALPRPSRRPSRCASGSTPDWPAASAAPSCPRRPTTPSRDVALSS